MPNKNYGFFTEPILPEDFLLGSDQSLGAKYGAEVYLNEKGDWTPYTPSTEDQSTNTGDTYSCVSHGTHNAVEMLARLRFQNSLNLSDRFLAKTSGTIVGQGNSPKKVADTLRHGWSVLEPEWPDVDTVEEFYKDIPQNLKTLAVARGAEFEFGYQYVPNTPTSVKAALRISPVCIAVTAWVEQGGVYVRGPFSENHWTTIIKVLENGNYLCFDSFAPFLKEVSPEACKSVAMSYYLNKNVVKDSAFKKFIKLILKFFTESKPESITEPTTYTPTNTEATPVSTIPPAPQPVKPKYDWSTPTAARHSVRVICDEEGLTLDQKNTLTACVQQESNFKNSAVGRNMKNGKLLSTDWGIAQINDYWHCGPGKDFPSAEYVVANPDAAIRYMARMFKAGQAKLWVSYSSGAYKKYL